jgi:glycine/D-amino acid oxidase-like deaminating enzyme
LFFHTPCSAAARVVVAAGAWTGEVLAASGVGEAWAGAFAPRKGHLIEVDAPPLSLTAGTMEAAYGAHYGGAAVEATGAFALTDDERARGVVFTAAPTADEPQRRMIHAYWGRACVESWVGPWWSRRLSHAFAFPELGPWRR